MPLRLLQVTLPADAELDDDFAERQLLASWPDGSGDFRIVQLAVPAEETEGLMDSLEGRFGDRQGFRLALVELEALLPRPEEDEEKDKAEGAEASPEEGEEETESSSRHRISREELYTDLTDGLAPSPVFLAMVGLSAVVAAAGLLRDDVAVVIGAMVIAPLLQPNIALALATTLGDANLAWRALKSNVAGLLVAVGLSAFLGWLVPVDPEVPALASRSILHLDALPLALAAGAAGALAFTRGLSGAVIGVMVAVALVPPAVGFGLLVGAGLHGPAFGAFLLTAGNLICINLAAVGTFLAVGVRPRSLWDAERARKSSLAAVVVWIVLLVALVLVLAISGQLPFELPFELPFGF